ncbi:hypothetical protein Scep_029352 [Stephania cephalantha]|uniref:Uncharacterized protein n=1 Tax=Stephania cephalantha TaxID=152367 RepID=A0AAP0DXP2_9MAGN
MSSARERRGAIDTGGCERRGWSGAACNAGWAERRRGRANLQDGDAVVVVTLGSDAGDQQDATSANDERLGGASDADDQSTADRLSTTAWKREVGKRREIGRWLQSGHAGMCEGGLTECAVESGVKKLCEIVYLHAVISYEKICLETRIAQLNNSSFSSLQQPLDVLRMRASTVSHFFARALEPPLQ